MKGPEYTNLYRNKVGLSFGGKVGVTARGYRVSSWVDENVLKLTMATMVISHNSEILKTI